MKLSNEQLEQFNSSGYLILRNFLNEEICDEILEKAKEHLKRKEAPIESEQEYMNVNEEKITDPKHSVSKGEACIYQVGKRKFKKITL